MLQILSVMAAVCEMQVFAVCRCSQNAELAKCCAPPPEVAQVSLSVVHYGTHG